MSYRDDFRHGEREYYWTLPRVFLGLFMFLAVFGAGFWLFSLATQPARVITKTFDADNMINNYEWYYEASNQVKARTAQITAHKSIVKDNTDPSERTRLRVELSAMQQSCRDLVGRYNANATKVNRAIFMGREAPTSLDPQICE